MIDESQWISLVSSTGTGWAHEGAGGWLCVREGWGCTVPCISSDMVERIWVRNRQIH